MAVVGDLDLNIHYRATQFLQCFVLAIHSDLEISHVSNSCPQL